MAGFIDAGAHQIGGFAAQPDAAEQGRGDGGEKGEQLEQAGMESASRRAPCSATLCLRQRPPPHQRKEDPQSLPVAGGGIELASG
jgi:hypothetical protein